MTLELDELWSLVLKKANDSWIWIALCRKMLPFSKSVVMHEACLLLFLRRYKRGRAILLAYATAPKPT